MVGEGKGINGIDIVNIGIVGIGIGGSRTSIVRIGRRIFCTCMSTEGTRMGILDVHMGMVGIHMGIVGIVCMGVGRYVGVVVIGMGMVSRVLGIVGVGVMSTIVKGEVSMGTVDMGMSIVSMG